MRYHIWTIGCQMNSADSQRLGSELEKLGYRWTDEAESADVIVLNTCVVRQQVEDKIYGRLGALRPVREERPETVVALMGCLIGHKPSRELQRRFPNVDVFLPPSETGPLVDLLKARAIERAARELESVELHKRWSLQDGPGNPSRQSSSQDVDFILPDHERGTLISAHVPIVYGCNWVCTFCIIPSRRGPERSRPENEIVSEVKDLVAQGVREVTLLGQIVDRYGYDRGELNALPGLLERLNDVEGLERIRFLTSHPNFMTDHILDAVATLPKVMEHIEVPVQAGDDEVLARMKRGYTADEYRRLVGRIRERVSDVAIHTDIIVGFCGETDAQFERTYALLEELELDKAHLAKFSPRPGTVAVKLLDDSVPESVKNERRRALDELQQTLSAKINNRSLGSVVEVLVDGRDGDRWRGRTRTNKLVYFEDSRPLLGRVVKVAIEWTGPWSMVGRAADAEAAEQGRREVIALTPA